MNEKYAVNIADIENTVSFDRKFMLKNPVKIYIFMAAGLLMIVIFRNLISLIIGLLFISGPLVNLIFIKDRILARINDTHVLIYDLQDDTLGYYFKWDNIKTYYPGKNTMGAECLIMELDDDSSVCYPLSGYSFSNAVRKKIPEKEKNVQMLKSFGELFKRKR